MTAGIEFPSGLRSSPLSGVHHYHYRNVHKYSESTQNWRVGSTSTLVCRGPETLLCRTARHCRPLPRSRKIPQKGSKLRLRRRRTKRKNLHIALRRRSQVQVQRLWWRRVDRWAEMERRGWRTPDWASSALSSSSSIEACLIHSSHRRDRGSVFEFSLKNKKIHLFNSSIHPSFYPPPPSPPPPPKPPTRPAPSKNKLRKNNVGAHTHSTTPIQ